MLELVEFLEREPQVLSIARHHDRELVSYTSLPVAPRGLRGAAADDKTASGTTPVGLRMQPGTPLGSATNRSGQVTPLDNAVAGWVVQSTTPGATPLYDRGITGNGEVINVVDTGLDESSCFFSHDGNPSNKVCAREFTKPSCYNSTSRNSGLIPSLFPTTRLHAPPTTCKPSRDKARNSDSTILVRRTQT